MGLFGKKKKEVKNPVFQPYEKGLDVPDFPESNKDLPLLEPDSKLFEPFKKSVHEANKPLDTLPKFKTHEDISIPERKKKIQESFRPASKLHEHREISHERAKKQFKETEKSVFVKMERYKEVLDMVEKIKERLNEVDGILAELNRIRREEDKELDAWYQDLERIKGQLLDLDKRLFEQ